MNTKSNQIETELNRITKRLDELTQMRAGINNNLQTLQQSFIDGKTSLNELQTEQGKLTTLDSSIKALEARQSELHDAFQMASLSESRQILLEKAKAAANEAESLHGEYLEMRNDFDASIRSSAEKMLDKVSAFRGKQREYLSIVRQIQPKISTEPSMESRQAKTDISEELERLGLTSQAIGLATTNHINYTPAKFGECIAIAERLVGEEKYREQQDNRAKA